MSIDHKDLEQPWDLVVIGHGAAGLSAAVSFLETWDGPPARVAVLDKAAKDQRGGSTAWTTAQFRLDADAQLLEDWGVLVRKTNGENANEEYIEAFYENATDTLNWVRKHGVTIGKMRIDTLPSTSFKYAYSIQGGGGVFVDTFSTLLEKLGGTALYETTAVGIEREPGGSVTGVQVRTSDGSDVLLPTRSVVVAAGGFEGNRELLAEHIPGGERLDTVSPGSRVNDGSGIAIARAAGADTAGAFDGAHMEACDPRSANFEALIHDWVYGILVDGNGERFFDEASAPHDLQFDYIANAVHRQADGRAYSITDASVRGGAEWIKSLNWTEVAPIVADSLEELAAKLNVPPAALRTTVDAYNAASADTAYDPTKLDGKHTIGLEPPKSHWAQPLTEAPFHAYPIEPRICFTYFGLKVDGQARVIDTEGKVIPGLYAAGEITGLFTDTYPSGTSVHRSLTFGRVAGREIAGLARNAEHV